MSLSSLPLAAAHLHLLCSGAALRHRARPPYGPEPVRHEAPRATDRCRSIHTDHVAQTRSMDKALCGAASLDFSITHTTVLFVFRGLFLDQSMIMLA